MNILVTGGAGYVGSHTVRLLERSGHQVTVYDNLSTGHRAAPKAVELIEGELTDRSKLQDVMRQQKIEAVMHFAAFSLVGESVTNPAKYYQNNIVGTCSLLEAMRATDVKKIVFSSTTAIFGEPESMPIDETKPQQPINPYGFTKLVIEHALRDYSHAYGLHYAALRYFNAAGASPDGDIGEHHEPESHLIPIILQVALGQRDAITIFGNDYPTQDGTCIRDYVHVDDLATAHLASLEKLSTEKSLELNLGTGYGHSVLQVIDACRKATGHAIPSLMGERRAGDPPELVADSSLAQQTLSWQPQYIDIQSIVETAWQWHKSHPQGYAE